MPLQWWSSREVKTTKRIVGGLSPGRREIARTRLGEIFHRHIRPPWAAPGTPPGEFPNSPFRSITLTPHVLHASVLRWCDISIAVGGESREKMNSLKDFAVIILYDTPVGSDAVVWISNRGNPPALPGDSRSLTDPGVVHQTLTVNRSKFHRQEI